MSDLLSNGRSARLFQRLVKELGLFSDVNAFITGDIDDGLFVITGRLVKGTTFEQGEAAIDEELGLLTSEPISEYELEKVKNKFESNFTFGETSPLDKAMNLCFFELVSQAEDINQEVVKYRSVSAQRVMEVANELFRPENSSTLLIKAKN